MKDLGEYPQFLWSVKCDLLGKMRDFLQVIKARPAPDTYHVPSLIAALNSVHETIAVNATLVILQAKQDWDRQKNLPDPLDNLR